MPAKALSKVARLILRRLGAGPQRLDEGFEFGRRHARAQAPHQAPQSATNSASRQCLVILIARPRFARPAITSRQKRCQMRLLSGRRNCAA